MNKLSRTDPDMFPKQSTISKIIPQKRSISLSTSHLDSNNRQVSLSNLPQRHSSLSTFISTKMQSFKKSSLSPSFKQKQSAPTPLQLLEEIAISFIRQLDDLDIRRQEELELINVETLSHEEVVLSLQSSLHSKEKESCSSDDEMLSIDENEDEGEEVEESQVIGRVEKDSEPEIQETNVKSEKKIIKKKVVKKMKQVILKVGVEESVVKPSTYLFPTLAITSTLRLARLLKIISEMQSALLSSIIITKRDIFYRDPKLFGKQKVVDNLVDFLSLHLKVKRSALGIVATSKGLITGSLLVEKFNGQEFTVQDGIESLIPSFEIEDVKEIKCDVEWILIVEKDASFKTLMEEGITLEKNDVGKGIMITGKGYPDLATRQMLKILSISLPNIPILALVDADPHGLDILRIYKYGTLNATELSVEKTEWAGVKGSEWDELGIEKNSLLPLTLTDRMKTLSMLSLNPPLPKEWRRELARSLHLNQKAEIQLLCSVSSESLSSSKFQSQGMEEEFLISSGILLSYVRSKIRDAVERSNSSSGKRNRYMTCMINTRRTGLIME